MISLNQINDNLRYWIASVTGLDEDNVRPANQAAPDGTNPYCTVLLSTLSQVGHDGIVTESRDEDVDIDETREGDREIVASINFYGSGSKTNASKLLGAPDESAQLAALNEIGIGFQRFSDSRDLSQVIYAKTEERAQVDMFFYFSDTSTNTVTSIQSQQIDLNINGQEESIEVEA